MNILKKIMLGALVVFMTLLLSACPPNAEPPIPTDTIKITNIPKVIYRTNSNSDEVTAGTAVKADTYKVYVQLSDSMSPEDPPTALGSALISTAQDAGTTYTVTITDLLDADGQSWSGINYRFVSVVISPEIVDEIYDIDAGVYFLNPTGSSTVGINWKGLLSKSNMGIASYLCLYGELGRDDGIIVVDTDITNSSGGRPLRVDPAYFPTEDSEDKVIPFSYYFPYDNY